MNHQYQHQNVALAARHAEVAEFMTTSLDGTKHPALLAAPGSGVVVNAQHTSVDPECLGDDVLGQLEEIYHPCILAQKDFIATVNKHRKKLKLPEFDQATPTHWSDVSEAVVSACNEIEKMTEVMDKNVPGSMGKLKSGFRKLCKHIEKGETFVSLIPKDAFALGSTLGGALNIVFSALKSTGAHRLEVYNILEELPFILTDRVASIKWFQRDEELHRRTAALFASIFRLLQHILSWLLKGSFVTGLRTLTDPTGLPSALSSFRKDMILRAERFRSHAANLAVAFQRDFDQFALARQENNFSKIGGILLGIESNSRDSQIQIMSALAENAMRSQTLEALIPLLLSSHEASIRRMLENVPPAALKDSDCNQIVDEILDEYEYDVDLLNDDVQFLLSVLSHPGRRVIDHGRLYAIQSSSHLRAWGLVDESSLLLIHGRALPRPESAVSLASAQIVNQMLLSREKVPKPAEDRPFVIPIAFFCGQHRGRDVLTSSTRLMLNLILQLLDRGRHILTAEALNLCWEYMQAEDIDDLCSIFQSLVTSLPSNVFVFVVIDGISFFARTANDRAETRIVIASLVDIHRQLQTKATLKFLFTSPLRPQFVEDLFDDDEILNIPRDIRFHRSNSNSLDPGCPESDIE